MTYRLFVNSSTGVDVEPEWGFKDSGKKVETRHRTRSGEEYVYRWGDYRTFDVPVMYVSSSTMAIVNSWWNSNTELLFMEEGSTDVSSVHISNKSKPIDSKIKPYDNLFKGTIKLSTY